MKISAKEWNNLGIELFKTQDKTKWKFKCPSCGVSIVGQEWIDAKAEGQYAFSCIGRSTKPKGEFLKNKKQPCNYAGGGLFKLNPIEITYKDGDVAQAFSFDHPDFQI